MCIYVCLCVCVRLRLCLCVYIKQMQSLRSTMFADGLEAWNEHEMAVRFDLVF